VVIGAAIFAAALALLVWSRSSSDASPWIDVASSEELLSRRVIYVEEAKVFVVARGSDLVALRSQAPHVPDDHVLFCPSSGWFEGRHGERFDRLGRYALGPASEGLTRVAVRVDDTTVQIDPSVILGAEPRSVDTEPPGGPFCSGGGELVPASTPGYAAPEG
jgi:hypothetical protein